MRKLQITKGIATISSENEFGILITTSNPLCDVATVHGYGNPKEEHANAQLIADAFNTANKCDILQSELLDIIKQINDSNFEISCELQDKIVQLFKK